MNKRVVCLLAFFAIVLACSNSYAQQPGHDLHRPGPSVPMEAHPAKPVEKVSPGIFRIGDILLNKNEKSISFPAQVNMDKGLLEYLIVSSGGKTHESLFRTKIQPYDLHIAFLLLGFEGADQKHAEQGYPEKPDGEPVEITVEYTAQKLKEKTGTENWIIQIIEDQKKEVEKFNWIFTGSFVVDGMFIAQNEGSIAAVYRDPTSLVNNASKGGESDEIWFVKEGTVPPVGTPVTIIIRAKK